MTEPSGRDPSPAPTTPASSRALWAATAGHLLALVAVATGSIPLNIAIVAAVACSIIAVAALAELAPGSIRAGRATAPTSEQATATVPDSAPSAAHSQTAITDEHAVAAVTHLAPPPVSARSAITAVTVGHFVAAAILLAGPAPSLPSPLRLIGLAAAVALDIASLAALRVAASLNRQPRPLIMAPRIAAIVLVAQALLQRAAESSTRLSMPLRAAIFLALAVLGVALLATFSIIALRVRPRWALAALLAWTVGWVALTADLASLLLWSFGGPFPLGPQQLRLNPELVQLLSTAGGVGLGAALITSIHDPRFRHSAVVLLAGYALFGFLAAVAEHRIDVATDFPGITAFRKDRDLADTIRAFPLAGVFWLYWRRVAAVHLRRRGEDELDSVDDDPR